MSSVKLTCKGINHFFLYFKISKRIFDILQIEFSRLVHVVREEVEHEPVAELGHAQDLAQLVPHVLPRGHDVRAQIAVPQRPACF